MVCSEVELLQRRIAVVNAWADVVGFLYRIELVLLRIILMKKYFRANRLKLKILKTHNSIVEPHGDHEIGKLTDIVVRH